MKPLLILITSIIVLAGVGYILINAEHQRLVNYAVSKVNQKIKGEITIQESDFSLFKHFPYVSIVLEQTKLFQDKSKGTPIVGIDRLYLGFSISDILKKNYHIRSFSIHGGDLNMVLDVNGKFNILSAIETQHDSLQATDADTTQFRLNLDKAVFNDFRVALLDHTNGTSTRSHITELTASFALEGKHLATELQSEMEVDFKSPGDTTFFRHKKITLDMNAGYKMDEQKIIISKGNFKLQDASFIVQGSAQLGQPASIDFLVNGDKPDMNLLAAFLPGDAKKILKPFRYDGRIYFNGIVSGELSNGKLPLIEVSFGCEDAWFINTSADRKVDKLGFKGYYTNGAEHSLRTSELHLTNVSARPEKGIFEGNFIMHDFTDPKTLVQIRSELELKFLGEFLGIPDLKQTTGKIKLDMDFKDLSNIQLPEQSLNKLKEGIQSKLVVENLSFRIPGYPLPVRNMNVHAEMKDGKVTLDSATLRIGESDLRLSGTLSDIQAFVKNTKKAVTVTVNVSSKKIMFKELLASDTALARKADEEIRNFNVRLSMETSVEQLLHPAPLPKGKLEIKDLRASFKTYPHVFKDLGATLTINEDTLRLRNFTGMIDQSDFKFSGRIRNYQLWFQKIKKGKTEIAFDFKSNRFSLADVLGPVSRKYIPKGYRREEANNVWLRAKSELRYDTVFKFSKTHIANITGDLKNHNFKLKDIHGNIKYGNRVVIIDTLVGTIGKSDFDVNLYFFTGADKKFKRRDNYFRLASKFLDVDELNEYTASATRLPQRKADSLAKLKPVVKKDSSVHAKAFNIFAIPFADLNVEVNVEKLKFNKLWLKDVSMRSRMQEDHQIYIDTLSMQVAGGGLRMNGQLNGTDTAKIYFRSTIKMDNIDLEKMMVKLDHYGQDLTINKNIKGILSGQIKSYFQVHPNFVPIISKAKAELDIRIYQGSLVDFAPMQAMSNYFKDKNLRNIRFDTLQNKLSFSNETLSIPSMNINSSLGYIEMSGKQSLDLSMEYYIRVPLKLVTKVGMNALFGGKSEEVDVNQIDEIEHIDKEKKISFMNLKVSGKPENFKVVLAKNKK
ncbi:MAG: hypothetical protein HOP08_05640 [Cyclobacteriaceae bacterium]|nr:hypothetical protein [Cyclobacteriaceae bacterium]